MTLFKFLRSTIEKKYNGLESNILPFNFLKNGKSIFEKSSLYFFHVKTDGEAGLIELEKIIWNASSLNLSTMLL